MGLNERMHLLLVQSASLGIIHGTEFHSFARNSSERECNCGHLSYNVVINLDANECLKHFEVY